MYSRVVFETMMGGWFQEGGIDCLAIVWGIIEFTVIYLEQTLVVGAARYTLPPCVHVVEEYNLVWDITFCWKEALGHNFICNLTRGPAIHTFSETPSCWKSNIFVFYLKEDALQGSVATNRQPMVGPVCKTILYKWGQVYKK